jgi:hypothetical protein
VRADGAFAWSHFLPLRAAVAVAAGGCAPFAGGGEHTMTVASCPSPEGRAVATLTRVQGGGGPGWEYNEVRVHARGAAPDSARPVFAMAGDRQLHAYWHSPRELVVEYPQASQVRHLEGVRALPDTVWVEPRPVRDLQFDLSDVPGCRPYRPSWVPAARGAP